MEAKIITVANMKGGVGKSTLTSIFASYLHNNKKNKTLVIDADDTQQTVSMTRKKDLERGIPENTLYEILSTNSLDASEYITSLIPDFDYIFIDLPGNLKQKGVLSCLIQIDLFIIPTTLSDEDLDATIRFIDLLFRDVVPEREQNGLKTNLYGILYKVSKRSKEYSEFSKNIKDFPIPFFAEVVPNSDVMKRAISTANNMNYISKTFHIGNIYKEFDNVVKI